MISIKFSIYLTLFLCVSNYSKVLGQSLSCSQSSDKRVDELFARVVAFGKSGRRFPENDQQLSNFCGAQNSDLKTMGDYVKKCMTGLGKQIFKILGYTIRNHISKICKKNSRLKDEILSAGKCWNQASDRYEKCNALIIDNILGIQNAEDKMKIPHLCCQLYKIKDCYHESEEKTNVCIEKHSEASDNYIDSLSANAFTLMCGDYTDNSKCDSLGAVPKKRSNQKRTRSFFVPAIKVLESFAEI